MDVEESLTLLEELSNEQFWMEDAEGNIPQTILDMKELFRLWQTQLLLAEDRLRDCQRGSAYQEHDRGSHHPGDQDDQLLHPRRGPPGEATCNSYRGVGDLWGGLRAVHGACD